MNSPHTDPDWFRYIPHFLSKRLMGRTQLHKAIHNTGWIFFDKILRAVLGLLVGAWVARYLGPGQFGELAYYIAFIALFQGITNLGLDGIAVREISHHQLHPHVILGTIYRLRVYAGMGCWLLAILSYGVIEGVNGPGIYIIGLVGATLVFQASDTVDLWFQGQSQSKRTVVAKAIAYLLINSIKVILILMQAPMIAFVLVIAAESLLNALALFIAYKSFPSSDSWAPSKEVARRLLQESWPYLLSTLAVIIYMRIDQIMIRNMLDDRSLGIFSAMQPIAGAWNIIPVAIVTSIAPFMTKKHLEGGPAFNNSLLYMFRALWVISLCAIGFTILISPYLIPAIFGIRYLDSIHILNIYVWTCLPIALGVGQGIWLLNERKPKLSMIQTACGALASVLTNLALIPSFGLVGAAYAAILSQVISTTLINLLISRKLFFLQMGIKPPRWAS
ncbi:flippase [Polynucleobacter asymbioticus]|uniref:flippase n=1 Tax=Polynucleobacter asymbioticus TaxID=576611 RepID=UPI0008F869C6|nr:flippase [Polynucleobacter asymbioticus]